MRATPTGRSGVSLLDADAALAAAVPEDERPAARDMLRVGGMSLPVGAWTLPDGVERALGLLVVDGLLLREQAEEARGQVALLGPGDLADVRPLVDGRERWRVARPATVAVIDARVLLAGRRWPRLFAALMHRLFDMSAEQARLNRMLALPRVEERLLELVGHYADRWGHVTPAGRVVDLPLTHLVLGRLVGARRPTVSLALGTLAAEGRLLRDQDGRWVLPAVDAALEGAAPALAAAR